MESIIILTYDCNFRCTYCDIDKRKEGMSNAVFEQSIAFLSGLDKEIGKLKFFGGEPLLEERKIRIAVQSLSGVIPNFYVTTNASLLQPGFIEFAQKNALHVTVSLDGDRVTTESHRKTLSGKSLYDFSMQNSLTHASSLRVNQVITSETASRFYENFLFLYNQGFRNFNFLPEYYREWSKEGLRDFIKNIKQVKSFIKDHPITLVNAENYSATSFFNLGIVIDTDGSIYGTNLILSGKFEKYKAELRIGSVTEGIPESYFSKASQDTYIKHIEYFIKKEYSPSVLASVRYVDTIISELVYSHVR